MKILFPSIVLFFFLSSYNSIAFTEMKAPFPSKSKRILISNENLGWAYSFYKKYISPIDGSRCQMYPSCSIFAKDTFNKFGFFKGYLLTMDRLTRCGHDLHSYSHIMLNGKEYSIDFIESNIDSVFEGNK